MLGRWFDYDSYEDDSIGGMEGDELDSRLEEGDLLVDMEAGGSGAPQSIGSSRGFSYAESHAGTHAPGSEVGTSSSGRRLVTPRDFTDVQGSLMSRRGTSKPLVKHHRGALRQTESTSADEEPTYFFARSSGSIAEALRCDQPQRYEEAVRVEYNNLFENEVLEPASLPAGHRPLNSFGFVVDKMDASGSYEKTRARIVARGDQQDESQYDDINASVLMAEHFRLFIALCASLGMKPWAVDIKAAFLQVPLEEELYLRCTAEHERFMPAAVRDQIAQIRAVGGHACFRIRKTLYGLKQGPHNWMADLTAKLEAYGLSPCWAGSCLWASFDKAGRLQLLVCVFADDIGIASTLGQHSQALIDYLHQQYKVGTVRPMTDYIGYKVERDEETGSMRISQPGYTVELIDRFMLTNCKPVSSPFPVLSEDIMTFCPEPNSEEAQEMKGKPYRQLIGGLNYLSTTVRPDIAIPVRLLAKAQNNPGVRHWKLALRVLRYLSGTTHLGITYEGGSPVKLSANADASWAENKINRRSTCGFFTVLAGGPINWDVVVQSAVALSTSEAEYYGIFHCLKDVCAMRDVLQLLGFPQEQPTPIDCDNQSAIKWAHGGGKYSAQKHIAVHYNFVQQKMAEGKATVLYLPTDVMPADLLTKVLPPSKLEVCRDRILSHSLSGDSIDHGPHGVPLRSRGVSDSGPQQGH